MATGVQEITPEIGASEGYEAPELRELGELSSLTNYQVSVRAQ
jgi:hypothetical protein